MVVVYTHAKIKVRGLCSATAIADNVALPAAAAELDRYLLLAGPKAANNVE